MRKLIRHGGFHPPYSLVPRDQNVLWAPEKSTLDATEPFSFLPEARKEVVENQN